MSAFLRLYLEINALLLLGALGFGLCALLAPDTLACQPRRWLRIGGSWLAAAFVVPAAARIAWLSPTVPAVLAWARDLGAGPASPPTPLLPWHAPASLLHHAAIGVPLRLQSVAAWLLVIIVASLGVRLIWRVRQLADHCASLPVVRRRGRVVICATDDGGSPFSMRAGGVSYIVVPTAMWADPARVRMVVAHEAGHLRHGDLQMALLLQLLAVGLFWNPAVRLWARLLHPLQELACDRRAQRRFGPVRYGQCLIWAAEIGRTPLFRLTGALHMARSPTDGLKRRIRMLFIPHTSQKMGVALAIAATVVGLTTMASLSLTAMAATAEVEIDIQVAQRMADQIRLRTGFVVPVDDWVVAQLNQLIGPRRDWSRQALARLQPLRAALEQQMAAADLPRELIAVAFAESGFDTSTPTAMGNRGGIWEFLPATARDYGLEVGNGRDDRLDNERATRAAAALLRDLHSQLGDWPLAIAGYNSGGGRVLAVVKRLGSRDVALLARTGKLGQDALDGYTQTVLAAMLLLNNPELAQ
jgi:membrane-bound lytic murein transglycosylase D